MNSASRVSNFEDLKIFQQAHLLALKVYEESRKEAFRRDNGLSSQIQRASVSVLSNIAEGFKRGTTKELIQFLYISKGSCGELRAQLILANSLRYIDQQAFTNLNSLCKSLSSMIWSFISYLKRCPYSGSKYQR